MALTYVGDVRNILALTLRAFFEPHGTTDTTFDQFCGWDIGTTRNLLDGIRDPTHSELIEICMRANEPLATFVRTRYIDHGRN